MLDIDKVRTEPICRGCGDPKELREQQVCGMCFKHRADVVPMKYWAGGLESWLEYIALPANERSSAEMANEAKIRSREAVR